MIVQKRKSDKNREESKAPTLKTHNQKGQINFFFTLLFWKHSTPQNLPP
jgi:hypothetical protein